MKLAKGHGLGNDFLIVADADAPKQVGEWARRLCERHIGVGADGVLLYALEPDGLTVTHHARNVGDDRAPWAVGAHPYFRIGETPVELLTLRVDRPQYLELDDRMVPVAAHEVAGTGFDLRHARPLAEVDINTAYGDLEAAIGRSEAAWLESPDGSRLAVWLDEDFRFLQIYTPRAFPRPEGAGLAVAIEPMTAAPDALNSGWGLMHLDPGESWTGSWGVRYASAL